jgi:CubicO group peptidase (beta-lactamase class C family)
MKLLTLACSAALLIAARTPDPAIAALDGAMIAYATPATPGCAVGVIQGGRLAHARGYGAADLGTGRQIDARTAFNLASMSKSFTAAAVALLVRDGTIELEDDIRQWLPELPDYGRIIRVRHLLHHTSGLRNHMALAAFQPGAPLPSHAEALALVFRQSALNFDPGSRHQYESPNYVLLAEIVARASGKSFARFLDERIFIPLGMRNTGFSSPGLARVYAPNAEGGFALSERVNGARGSSNLLSTLEDFAIWLAALDSDRLAPGLLAQMIAGTRLNDGSPVSYGYGLAVARDHDGIAGLTMIAHGGQTAAWRSQFNYFPGRGFGVIMLCNAANAPRQAAQAAVEAWVGAHFTRPAPAPPAEAAPLAPEEAARYAGTWLDAAGDEVRTFTAEGGRLNFVYAGRPYPLDHRGGGRFALGDIGEFRFSGGEMVETGTNQPAIAFARQPPAQAVVPADFAGIYRSPDVDGELVVRAGEGGGLALAAPFGEMPLDPIHPDGFAAAAQGIGHVAFVRDRDGAVSGLTITTLSGIGRMRFDRAR